MVVYTEVNDVDIFASNPRYSSPGCGLTSHLISIVNYIMAFSQSSLGHASGILLLLITLLSSIDITTAADTKVIQTTNNAGEVIYLADDRKPALYTQNFGDCLGNSLINVTRFDAAYYQDNMTVLFHLEGNTAITNESLMSMFILSL